MAEHKFQTVDEYIASCAESERAVLSLVRRSIQKAVPQAEESISYNMPTYKLNGKAFLYFAGWKRYYSLYPASNQLVAAFLDELKQYEVEKSAIRFPLSGPVPTELIERLAKFRAEQS
jgi:uncharacterized protein YdhG (YjbR/CyaY superfamily)